MRSVKVVEWMGRPHLRWFVDRKPRYRLVKDSSKVDQQIYELRKELEQKESGEEPPPPAATQEETLDLFHTDILTGAKQHQADAVLFAVRRVLTEAKIKNVKQITLARVRTTIHRLRCVPRKQQKSPPLLSEQTRKHYARHLKQFTKWLVRERYLQTDPLTGWKLKVVKEERNPRTRLQPEEFAKLITTTMESPYRTGGYDGETRAWLYLLAATTGLRRGELASLTPQSFDWSTNTLCVAPSYTKDGKTAVLPIHAGLVAELRRWVKERPGEIFPKLKDVVVARLIRLDLQRAGIPYKTEEGTRCFHSLRNTYISALFDLGASMATIQRLARHSDIRLTAKYAKPLAAEAEIVDRIPCIVPRVVADFPESS